MQRTRFDFDVITGPASPRPPLKPEPKPAPDDPGPTQTPRHLQQPDHDTGLREKPRA